MYTLISYLGHLQGFTGLNTLPAETPFWIIGTTLGGTSHLAHLVSARFDAFPSLVQILRQTGLRHF